MINENNEINGIKNDLRLESQKIIEECMILANVASSLFIKKIRAATLYRIHDEPTFTKIEEASIALKNIGYNLSKQRYRVQKRLIC